MDTNRSCNIFTAINKVSNKPSNVIFKPQILLKKIISDIGRMKEN